MIFLIEFSINLILDIVTNRANTPNATSEIIFIKKCHLNVISHDNWTPTVKKILKREFILIY